MPQRLDAIAIEIPRADIAAFCSKWKVREFALFGSILREDFGPESDIDVLVSFEDAAMWNLFDFADMIDELEALFGRPVDLVEREGLRNPIRRRAILNSKQVVYAAQ